MKHLALLVPMALAACATQPQTTESTYNQSETGVAMRTTPDCRVVSARYVQLIGERSSGGQALGTIAGGVIGASIGNELGGDAATVLGGLGGAAAGSRITSDIENRNRTATGVEYTVRVGSSERVIVQNFNDQSRLMSRGSACRIIGGGSNTRVVPA